MVNFCEELQIWASKLPHYVPEKTLYSIPIVLMKDPTYKHLASVSSMDLFATKLVLGPTMVEACAKAKDAYMEICKHPVLGQFRPDKPDFFYERALYYIMSLQLEHNILQEDIQKKQGITSRTRLDDPVSFVDAADRSKAGRAVVLGDVIKGVWGINCVAPEVGFCSRRYPILV